MCAMSLSWRPQRRAGSRVDVLLVCSAGGHLMQLFLLREAWAALRVAWVTHDKDDSRSLLEGERLYVAYGPTTRNIPNLFRNARLAYRLVRELRPTAIVTTGAGVAVPFAWFGRFLGADVIYIESLSRTRQVSLSCRLIRPIASRTYVQWPELAQTLSGARYVGNVLTVE
jgi:beta-1,4-N-acetylglucosaminyltransferase